MFRARGLHVQIFPALPHYREQVRVPRIQAGADVVHRAVEARVGDVGAGHLGPAKIRAAEIRAGQI